MKRLVLLGGGHSHLEVLRSFGRAPLPGTELVLINPGEQALYSGMLPGFVAGHYRWEDCVFDLPRLAAYAGARFMAATASGIDPGRREVRCEDGSVTGYDILSIDIGSAALTGAVPGAAEHAFPLKPFTGVRERLRELIESVAARPGELRIAVVGAGAGGVEICLALEYQMRTAYGRGAVRLELVCDREILPGHNSDVRNRVMRILRDRQIEVRCGSPVAEVHPGWLILTDGNRIETDRVVWATGAAPAPWLRKTGLALEERGFLQVNARLQSTSHPQVFAAGDVACIEGNDLPRAGVHAVRQGPVLASNLHRSLSGGALQPFTGKRGALYLLATGERRAVMSWGAWALEGGWIWRWKNFIDRRFMEKYHRLHH